MTIIYAASPGTASSTFNRNLELILNCKAKKIKSSGGIGHVVVNIPIKKKFLKKFKLDFFDKSPLIRGHIFPTIPNLGLLNYYYDISHFIISYRNIYDQLNYFYKWQKYKSTGPLSFSEEINFSNKKEFDSNDFNIDLNLLLVLNFYRLWFYLIQNNKIKNFTLISFEEITLLNEDYQKKIKYIFQNLVDVNKIKFNLNVKENLQKKEEFEINPRHKRLIDEFISFYKEVDFSLII
jgi:hypothetical protein